MALISQESLLGMLIPDVYIDGITLESSGTPAIEDNPHMDSTTMSLLGPACKKVTYLKIINCRGFTDEGAVSIGRNCKSLRVIHSN